VIEEEINMIYVIISNLIIVLMTLLAAGMSGNIILTFLIGGGLLISVTAGYVKDGEDKLVLILQFFLAVLFVLCFGKWWGCFIFVIFFWSGSSQLFLMSNVALLADIIIDFERMNSSIGRMQQITAIILLRFLILNIVVSLMVFVRYLIRREENKKREARRIIREYSLSELHEIEKNKELTKQSYNIDRQARLIERENISRNIHNSVGHSITAAIMTLDAADMLFDKNPKAAHDKMLDATTRIRGSLNSIRSAVRALDDEEKDISINDLICYFDNIIDSFLMDTERECDRLYEVYDKGMMIQREHAEFLTGALEECFTNGVKHGSANHFTVKLSGDSAHLRLDVKDNGKSGFNVDNQNELIENGFGIKKIISYAKRCGGTTEFRNENGFISVIELPIDIK
jgi:signal transduction histidine kinase